MITTTMKEPRTLCRCSHSARGVYRSFLYQSLLLLFITSCQLRPINHVTVIVRAGDTLVSGAKAILVDSTGKELESKVTSALGHVTFSIPDGEGRNSGFSGTEGRYRVKVEHEDQRVECRVDAYRPIIPVWITEPPRCEERFADMHYHLTLRTHNLFGGDMYDHDKVDSLDDSRIPSDLLWYYHTKKLRAYVPRKNGKLWRKAKRLDRRRIDRIGKLPASRQNGIRFTKYKSILTGRVIAAKGNNKLSHFSQATLPHLLEGQVKLAYNSISPFEARTSSTPQLRLIGSKIKSGTKAKWTRRLGMGKAKTNPYPLTHWENFQLELAMLRKQKKSSPAVAWRSVQTAKDLSKEDHEAQNLLVVEGGHVFQHELFPNAAGYDVGNRSAFESYELLHSWAQRAKENDLDATSRAILNKYLVPEIEEKKGALYMNKKNLVITIEGFDVNADWVDLFPSAPWYNRVVRLEPQKKLAPWQVENTKQLNGVINKVLEAELDTNIMRIRTMADPDPRVHMITVTHLSYNGMIGNAAAIDDATALGRISTKRASGIAIGKDPQYLNQWKGVFFSVPGPNHFGKYLLKGLLDDRTPDPILVDLKHCDLKTRLYFYDSLMTKYETPPICSHCAVTGLELGNASDYNDYYALERAQESGEFYPFPLNLFDEEVLFIHRNAGIIGLPLEHRVLGGYINKRIPYYFRIRRNGTSSDNSVTKLPLNARRFQMMKRQLKWLSKDTAAIYGKEVTLLTTADKRRLYDTVKRRVIEEYGLDSVYKAKNGEFTANLVSDRDERAGKIILAEYKSVEPFIKNLFHMVDLIRKDTGHWNESVMRRLIDHPDSLDTTRFIFHQQQCCFVDRGTNREYYIEEERYPWQFICIGSDHDGVVDPVDICPTASEYPAFKSKLKEYIPIFLRLRNLEHDYYRRKTGYIERLPAKYEEYFTPRFTIDDAMDLLFYDSLFNFTKTNIKP